MTERTEQKKQTDGFETEAERKGQSSIQIRKILQLSSRHLDKRSGASLQIADLRGLPNSAHVLVAPLNLGITPHLHIRPLSQSQSYSAKQAAGLTFDCESLAGWQDNPAA